MYDYASLCDSSIVVLRVLGIVNFLFYPSHYYKSEVQFTNLNHYGTFKMK
jgi:hypothetical protein